MLAVNSQVTEIEASVQPALLANRSARSSLKRLIVNADDLGLSHGITDAIFQCHAKGIVTSASLMVNQAATDYAVRRMQDFPTLDVGIHLNLCQGRPVLPPDRIPSLVAPNGHFLRPSEIGRRLVRWKVSSNEVEAEFCAQIDRMKSIGITPSHADSHHRFHIYPAAAKAFRNALASHGIKRARSATKATWPATRFAGAHSGPLFRRLTISVYNRFLQFALFGELKTPDAGIALHPRFRGSLSALPEAWLFALAHMPAGTYEIWCHPGFAQRGFSDTDPLREQRCVEAAMLVDPLLSETIVHAGIQLIPFRSL
jgi:chitin disaccharide deacetylase